jgi:hypothetical protein
MSKLRFETCPRLPVLAAMLLIAWLPIGCASVHRNDAAPASAVGVWLPEAEPFPTAPPVWTPVVADPDLEDATGADFRRRVLAQQRLLRLGADGLDRIARAREAAPAGSDRARTLADLIDQIQRKLPPERLAAELSEASGVRRLTAIRAAAAHGPTLVPALLALVTDRDPVVRREAVVVLREITDRHPSASGRGPVHAIRVWRAWYDAVQRERAAAPAPRAPRVRTDRPLAVSM